MDKDDVVKDVALLVVKDVVLLTSLSGEILGLLQERLNAIGEPPGTAAAALLIALGRLTARYSPTGHVVADYQHEEARQQTCQMMLHDTKNADFFFKLGLKLEAVLATEQNSDAN